MESRSIIIESISADELSNALRLIIMQELSYIQANVNPKNTSEIEKPLTQVEACEFLGKSRQTLVKWRKKGIIKSYRLNGRVYFKPSELLKALKEN